MFLSRAFKVFLITIVALAFASVANAFAAGNTFPDGEPKAGAGSETISGYAVTGVTYTLDGSNPVGITAVEFDLDAAATTVKVRLVTGGTLFDTCTGVVNHWTCTITGVTVSAANSLEVIAAQ